MDKWVSLFDVDKCTGCCNCVLATMDEHVDNSFPGYSEAMPRHGHKWLDIDCRERGDFPAVDVAYLMKACQHCNDPPCAKVAPDAVKKRPDGIVIIDPVASKGRRDLAHSCPFGAIVWNETLDIPQHWTMDAHLLDNGWKESRASQACPTGALQTRKMSSSELDGMRRTGEVEDLRPDLKLDPHFVYRNLKRVRTEFVSGNVTVVVNAQEECASGAKVTLHDAQSTEIVGVVETDGFGGFRIDGLTASERPLIVKVIASDGQAVERRFVLSTSMHLGVLRLE